MAREPLLAVDDLHVRFGTERGHVYAVNGVSFDIAPGETLGIVGESGCGKSVTSLAILGILGRNARVTNGRAMFGGRDLLSLEDEQLRSIRGKEIAMIFQDPMTSLNPVLTVGRQIREGLETHFGMERAQADKRAAELLDQVGIPSAKVRLKDYPHQFSGGMRQRAMIAMALACEPKLLIADEPTTALDVTIQAQILDLMRKLQQERGTAVILITHDLGVVAGFCDVVHVMYAGRIVESGPATAIYAETQHPYTAGLLGSVTRLDAAREDRLLPVRGTTPSLIDMPAGCAFHPRCDHVAARCRVEAPEPAGASVPHPTARATPRPANREPDATRRAPAAPPSGCGERRDVTARMPAATDDSARCSR